VLGWKIRAHAELKGTPIHFAVLDHVFKQKSGLPKNAFFEKVEKITRFWSSAPRTPLVFGDRERFYYYTSAILLLLLIFIKFSKYAAIKKFGDENSGQQKFWQF